MIENISFNYFDKSNSRWKTESFLSSQFNDEVCFKVIIEFGDFFNQCLLCKPKSAANRNQRIRGEIFREELDPI